jgi:hypothetical protein
MVGISNIIKKKKKKKKNITNLLDYFTIAFQKPYWSQLHEKIIETINTFS